MSGYGEFDVPNNDLTWLSDNEPVMGSTDRPVEPPDGSDGDTFNRMPKELLDNNLKNLDNVNELDLRLNDVKNTVATASQVQTLQDTIDAVTTGTSTPSEETNKLYLVNEIAKVGTPVVDTWNFGSGDFEDIPLNVKAIFGTYIIQAKSTGYGLDLAIQMDGDIIAKISKSSSAVNEIVGNSGFFMFSKNDNSFSSVSLGYALTSVDVANSQIIFRVMGYLK